MPESLQPGASQPTQDERTMALLAHMLQIVAWWIAPLVIFLIRRESRFTAFHALQALLLQAVYLVLMGVGVVSFFATFFLVMMAHAPAARNAPAPPLFLLGPLFWLGAMGLWVAVLTIAVVYGIKAGRGEWAEYPVLGPIALKMLKLRPGGVPL